MQLKRGINIIYISLQANKWMSDESMSIVNNEQYLMRSRREKKFPKMFIFFILSFT